MFDCPDSVMDSRQTNAEQVNEKEETKKWTQVKGPHLKPDILQRT